MEDDSRLLRGPSQSPNKCHDGAGYRTRGFHQPEERGVREQGDLRSSRLFQLALGLVALRSFLFNLYLGPTLAFTDEGATIPHLANGFGFRNKGQPRLVQDCGSGCNLGAILVAASSCHRFHTPLGRFTSLDEQQPSEKVDPCDDDSEDKWGSKPPTLIQGSCDRRPDQISSGSTRESDPKLTTK